MPQGVGLGQNVGLRDFYHIRTMLPPGASVLHKHMSSFVGKSVLFTYKVQYFKVGGICVSQTHLVLKVLILRVIAFLS